MNTKSIVTGAGLGGLAAAIRLAAAGRKVTVFEARPVSGGKAGEITLENQNGTWRFDSGPSLFTLPYVIDDLFAAAGERRAGHLQLVPLDPVTRCWFADGRRVQSSPDRQRFAESMERAKVATARELNRYLDYSRRIWDVTHRLFLERSLHEPLIGDPDFWGSLFRAGQTDPLRTMHGAHRRFFSDPAAVQFFDRSATYNGSSPYKTPATLNIIPHVEYGIGAWAVKGGTAAVPAALESLARRLGVEFRFESKVTRILYSGTPGSAKGARVTGIRWQSANHPDGTARTEDADEIICNADVTTVFQNLLQDPQAPRFRRYARMEPSSSALVFFWAMDSYYPEFGLHNILFSSDYRREFDDIFTRRRLPEDPTVYINITSKTESGDAPHQGENWFVLINAPPDDGRNRTGEIQRARRAVLNRIARVTGRDAEQDIQMEYILDPPGIARQTLSAGGSLYGISSNSKRAAFLRYPNRSRRYKGLYFAGGSAHPGGGMPLVMLSGKIAAELAVRCGENV